MADKPHILLFNPDQYRGDVLGHMGNPAAVTPNLDASVRTDAVSFRSAFCQNPVCTPSRCSFMSGWYPHTAGHRTMYHMMHPHEPVLLKALRDSGYFVFWAGKNDLLPGQNGWKGYADIKARIHPRKRSSHDDTSWRGEPGSDRFYSFYRGKLEKDPDEDVYLDGDWCHVLAAAEFIRNAPPDKPLCIYVPIGYPHPPYGVEEPYYSAIDRSKLPERTPEPDWEKKPSLLRGIRERQAMHGWSEERWTELRATYYGMCMRVDDQWRILLDALRDAGIYDETAAFFFADHGDFTGDYSLVEKTQNTFEDCLSRVPLIVKPPADADVEPRVSDGMVELIDMTATVMDFSGLRPDWTHFGRSLRPVIAGQTDRHRDAVFCEGGRLHGETHCMELESTSSQDPGGLYWPRCGLQSSEGPEHTKAAMCRTGEFKYVRRYYETDELYDLRSDPRELDNRIDDPSLAEPLARLKERMLTWYMETCDTVPHETDLRNFPPEFYDDQDAAQGADASTSQGRAE
jgi:arylsulfatase A-like enzyme